MIHTISQFDEFAPDAFEVRKAVIERGFTTETGPDGLPYTGISKYEVPHWYELISRAIGHAIVPRLSVFRINYAGEKPHSWIHSDDICASHASVLYLNPPYQCHGGTAFWRHTGLNIDRMPTAEGLAQAGMGLAWFLDMMKREWMDLTHWEQGNFSAMRWNRFVTYPTSVFHSRYPFEGFGSKPEDGRLIWASFFDIGESSQAVKQEAQVE